MDKESIHFKKGCQNSTYEEYDFSLAMSKDTGIKKDAPKCKMLWCILFQSIQPGAVIFIALAIIYVSMIY